MLKQIFHIIRGYLVWLKYKIKFQVNQRTVMLILTGENRKIDYYAMHYLETFIEQKIADKVIILAKDKDVLKWAGSFQFSFKTIVYYAEEQEILLLYDYYCFEEKFDNIVFTFTERPEDNMIGRMLRETEINEAEAVCLGYYCLRNVPESVKDC